MFKKNIPESYLNDVLAISQILMTAGICLDPFSIYEGWEKYSDDRYAQWLGYTAIGDASIILAFKNYLTGVE